MICWELSCYRSCRLIRFWICPVQLQDHFTIGILQGLTHNRKMTGQFPPCHVKRWLDSWSCYWHMNKIWKITGQLQPTKVCLNQFLIAIRSSLVDLAKYQWSRTFARHYVNLMPPLLPAANCGFGKTTQSEHYNIIDHPAYVSPAE